MKQSDHCNNCLKPIPPNRRPNARYCSDECREEHKQMTRILAPHYSGHSSSCPVCTESPEWFSGVLCSYHNTICLYLNRLLITATHELKSRK